MKKISVKKEFKKSLFRTSLFTKASIVTIILAALFLSACNMQTTPSDKPDITPIFGSASGQGIEKITSIKELKKILEEESRGKQYSGAMRMLDAGARMVETSAAMPATASLSGENSGANSGSAKASSGAVEYSTTNIQVSGVDEADFVKNDNKYIYLINDRRLLIIDAYPPEEATILANITVEKNPRNLLLDGDKLILFTDGSEEREVINAYDFAPIRRYRTTTKIIIYDLSDRKKPEILKQYTISGSYKEARLTDHKIYLVTVEGVGYYDYDPSVPFIAEGDGSIVRPELYRFHNPEQSYQYTTVASIDLEALGKDDDIADILASSFLTGYTSTVYMSRDALYFSYKKNRPWRWYEDQREEQFWKVVLPLLPEEIQREIRAIGKDEEDWPRIGQVLINMYDEMSKDERERLTKRISDALQEWEAKENYEYDKTIIQKIDIRHGLDYVGGATVPGTLLNQFSMDENNGELRVATTTQFWTREGSNSWSNVYLFDENMNLRGKLEKLAPDEQIYSARFLNNRLYLVTFQRTDPLFVIGLDSNNPEVLGELNMTGFSDYLHPYKSRYLIGVGKETVGNDWGGVSRTGIKMALYDVEDVAHPKIVDVVKIGGPGSTSEVSRDHKAFLLDEKSGLLVLPVREITDKIEWVDKWHYRRNKVWNGAYVYTISDKGFALKGKISHYSGEEQNQWYWGSPWAVRRSLFMDNTLYTISQKKLLMNNLGSLEKVNEIDLSDERVDYEPPVSPLPVPLPEIVK